MPPTLFWRKRGGSRNKYSATDLLLLEAFDIYERSLCSCGHPSWLTYDEAHSGEFEVDRSTVCGACKASESDKSERGPGVKLFVKHVVNDDAAPGVHELRLAKKRQEREQSKEGMARG